MKINLDHVAINVTDIDKSTNWYIENLQAEVLYRDESWAMLQTAGTKIALTVKSQHPPHLGFSVDSLLDIPCDTPAYHRDGSAYHYVNDPDGNAIEFVYYPPDSL